MSFESSMEFLGLEEGEWSNDPKDRGRRTRWGISERAHPEVDLDALDTFESTFEFYRTRYWVEAGCHWLPEPLDTVVMDAAVHSGVSKSVEWLQRSVDVQADGKFGEKTREAVARELRKVGVESLAAEVLLRRAMWMVKGFRSGWFSPTDPLHFLGGFWARTIRLAVLIGDHEDGDDGLP